MMSELTLLHKLARSLMTGQLRAAADPHRPHWHLAPPVGLLNDPVGFVEAEDGYHLFYQWNPLACAHGAKFWGHWRSADLVHWQHEPVALLPSEEYERNGCYSGSAVVHQGKIHLLYTGNVKYADGSRTAYQCLARQGDDGTFEKLGPVIDLPAGYTGHVRDPKVWRQGDHWYLVLGAQDAQLKGQVLCYRGDDLQHWQRLGELTGSGHNGLGEFGYMWECPDVFALDGSDVLICCPQGLSPQGDRYQNLFQSGYFVGQMDYASGRLTHGEFTELDLGFEFYAPQTTQTRDGRRLIVGWMGLPDENEASQPTRDYGWQHQMTCPRELRLVAGRLYQQPARELTALRGPGTRWQGPAEAAPLLDGRSAELFLQPQGHWQLTLGESAWLAYVNHTLTLCRRNWRTGEWETRHWHGELMDLRLLLDASSIELFINGGEVVMSSRYFPGEAVPLGWTGSAELRLEYWPLSPCMLEWATPMS